MNKLKFFLVALIATFAVSTASAQKTGYIRVDDVILLMPETGKIDSLLQRYQADSLNPNFAYLVSEYNRKDSMVNTKDSTKYTPAVRNQVRQELQGLAYQIQNWQGFVQEALQEKQNDLLEPIYRKVINAIQTVAKESGYAYVYNKEALLVAPPADDLLPLVAKKLNLKLPNNTNTATNTTPKK